MPQPDDQTLLLPLLLAVPQTSPVLPSRRGRRPSSYAAARHFPPLSSSENPSPPHHALNRHQETQDCTEPPTHTQQSPLPVNNLPCDFPDTVSISFHSADTSSCAPHASEPYRPP